MTHSIGAPRIPQETIFEQSGVIETHKLVELARENFSIEKENRIFTARGWYIAGDARQCDVIDNFSIFSA